MEKKQIFILTRIIVAGVLLGVSFFNIGNVATIVLCAVAYALVGYDVLWQAAKNIIHGKVFDEHFLMSVATIGALALQDFREAVAVMLFYQVGEFLQDLAVDKSTESISKLLDLRPDYCNVEKDGEIIKVDPKTLGVGDEFIVYAGERIAIDGVVVEGSSSLNTSALTGESVPVDVSVDSSVFSGSMNINGTLRIRATKLYENSTASQILEAVENAQENKAKSEKFITKFARVYTPVVVGLAVMLAVIPSCITGNWGEWIHRALLFLVVSCPCALVVSIPLSFFAGIGGASKQGILIKGATGIENLAEVKTVAFDKTGTLTKGDFEVSVVHPNKISEEELVEICALCELGSSHPIAKAIVNFYAKPLDVSRVTISENLAGFGVHAVVDGKEVYVGGDKMLGHLSLEANECKHEHTTIHVVVDGEYCGHLVANDKVKEESEQVVQDLKNLGISKILMLSGDKKDECESVAKTLGITDYSAEMLPNDKLNKIVEEKKAGKVAFVGDGINDALVLGEADVGIAMGAMGSDVAIGEADVVIMNDKTDKVADAIKVAKKTMRLVKENVCFTLGVKILMLAFGGCGIIGMWGAVFADVGVALVAICNALRALIVKKKNKNK